MEKQEFFTDEMHKKIFVFQPKVDYTKGDGTRYKIRKYVSKAGINKYTLTHQTG